MGGQKGCRVGGGVKRDVGWGVGGQKGCFDPPRVGCGGSKGM